MTKEEILKEYKSRENHITLAYTRLKTAQAAYTKCKREHLNEIKLRTEIKRKLSRFSSYKIGDKVTVFEGKNTGTLFNPKWVPAEGMIKTIIPKIFKNDNIEYEYKIVKITKKGTLSNYHLKSKHTLYTENDFKKYENGEK